MRDHNEPVSRDPNHRADWLQPPEEELGLKRYVETIKERKRLVLLTTFLATAAAVAYVLLAPKTYDAQADLLITPASSETLPGLPLIRESSQETRDVETAARLVVNTDVAGRAQKRLDLSGDPQDLLDDVTAEPVAQSNIVAVTATADSPQEAQDLANAFAEATVVEQTEALREEVTAQIDALEKQLASSPNPALSDRVAELQALVSGPNPNFRLETGAALPREQATPRPALTIVGGFLAGLVLGIVGAFASQAFDPRVRREEQLRRSFSLPILARVPEERSRRPEPLGPRRVSPATAEAFRILRSSLDRPGEHGSGRAIMVTGSSPSEGKTTAAANLASALALAGYRVILIEADLRRPSLRKALETEETSSGVVEVLIENASLEDSLVPTPTFGDNLRVLSADSAGGWIADLFSIPTASQMLDDARAMADFVIVDSPPLIEVVDAFPLARRCDDLVIVVRLGRTRLDRLSHLAELLAENDIVPAGFAVIGTKPPGKAEYSYYLETPDAGRKGKRRKRLGRKKQLEAPQRPTLDRQQAEGARRSAKRRSSKPRQDTGKSR